MKRLIIYAAIAALLYVLWHRQPWQMRNGERVLANNPVMRRVWRWVYR